jgi:hypothetical protein
MFLSVSVLDTEEELANGCGISLRGLERAPLRRGRTLRLKSAASAQSNRPVHPEYIRVQLSDHGACSLPTPLPGSRPAKSRDGSGKTEFADNAVPVPIPMVVTERANCVQKHAPNPVVNNRSTHNAFPISEVCHRPAGKGPPELFVLAAQRWPAHD